jgi:hypothetical protein
MAAATTALLFAVAACEDQSGVLEPTDAPAPALSSGELDGSTVDCKDTGTGLTAVVVNTDVIGQTIDVGDCDVGAFFSQDGVVENSTFTQADASPAPSEQYAVRVDGADVDVTGSEVDVVDDFGPQFIGIGYRDGATGQIADNTITGFHRVGILLDGAGTSADVKGNEVVGVGPKSTGWAENGIQVSRGATGTLKDNTVEDHWWNLNNFVSSGIIVFGSDGVTAHGNSLAGNDAALVVAGDDNNFLHNTVDVTDENGDTSGIFHAGAIVSSGENIGLRQNEFTTGSPAGSVNFGIFVTGAAVNTKLIRNTFDGEFAEEIVDQGDETKLPSPFAP